MAYNKKGFEKGMEVVIALLVLLILAVALIVFANSTVSKTEEGSGKNIEGAGKAIQDSLCELRCNSCKALGDGSCEKDLSPCVCT